MQISAPNLTKRRLESGGLALGFVVHQLRGAAAPMMARTSGFDWVFVDMEHGSYGMEGAIQICTAALAVGVTPIARVCEGALHDAGRLLDHGALGIVAPHVDTAEDAIEAVRACRFPPHGARSWIGGGPAYHYAPVPPRAAQLTLNEEVLVCVQIETPEAVANATSIAAVPGVDVLMVGTGDLSAAMGVPGEFRHPSVRLAYEQVADACARAGKVMGMGGVYHEPTMEEYIALGARFMLAGSDQNFLIAGASQRSQFLRRLDAVPFP